MPELAKNMTSLFILREIIHIMRKCIVCGKNFEHWSNDVCSIECSNKLEH